MRTNEVRLIIVALLLLSAFGVANAAQVEVATVEEEAVDEPFGDCAGDAQDSGDGSTESPVNCTDSDNVGMEDPDPGWCDEDPGGDQLGEQDVRMDLEAQPRDDCSEDGGGGGYVMEWVYDKSGNVIGLHIEHTSGQELSALCYREQSVAVESVRLSLERYDRVARIAKIPAGTRLQGGTVHLELNRQLFVFDTGPALPDAASLNRAMRSKLVENRYRVWDSGNYLLVHRDPTGSGIYDVRFASNDPAITHNDLALEPPNDFDFPYCFPPEIKPAAGPGLSVGFGGRPASGR